MGFENFNSLQVVLSSMTSISSHSPTYSFHLQDICYDIVTQANKLINGVVQFSNPELFTHKWIFESYLQPTPFLDID